MSSGMGEPGTGQGCRCKSGQSKTYDPLSLLLAALDKQLARLHHDLEQGNGDSDITQEQIGDITDELIDLLKRIK